MMLPQYRKAAAQGREPACQLTGDALLRSKAFIPFTLDCFARAVSKTVADEPASITRTRGSVNGPQPVLLILGGINGAGKSTQAAGLAV
jgi:hypothetical protein